MTLPAISIAVSMIIVGAVTLIYQRSGKRSFETLLIFTGLALTACGVAIARDVVNGSSNILWVVHHTTPPLSTASSI